MYKKNVVACIKVGGKILRESSDRVTLPFGSEYSILLKNLDSVRIQARIWIDGNLATENLWLIIEPNSSLEVERYIKNGNLNKGNRFKFIERTKPIEDARGIKEDDGLVRIEYKKEYVAPTVTTNIVRTKYIYDYDWDYYLYRPWRPYRDIIWSNNVNCLTTTTGVLNSGTFTQSLSKSAESPVRCMAMNNSSIPNEAGITVPGSESNQQFHQAQSFATESQSEVIVLHLVGTNEKSQPVKKAVTVDVKPTCVTCHKVNKATDKFCSRCGTALEII